MTSGVGVAGATRTLAAASTITTITETIPAGYVLASATCTGMGGGGTATPNLGTGALVLNAAATAAGSAIACTFTNTRLPTITLTKISNGAVGPLHLQWRQWLWRGPDDHHGDQWCGGCRSNPHAGCGVDHHDDHRNDPFRIFAYGGKLFRNWMGELPRRTLRRVPLHSM